MKMVSDMVLWGHVLMQTVKSNVQYSIKIPCRPGFLKTEAERGRGEERSG